MRSISCCVSLAGLRGLKLSLAAHLASGPLIERTTDADTFRQQMTGKCVCRQSRKCCRVPSADDGKRPVPPARLLAPPEGDLLDPE